MSRRIVLLFFCIAVPLLAQQPPVTERGFKPQKVYDFGQFDNVNTFNGNVMIGIPIGDRYKVNGNVGYGFTLSYNSKVWDYERANSPTPSDSRRYRRARGNRSSNAGLGWIVSLGRLIPPDSEENETPQPIRNWVYQSADGGDHPFAQSLHEGDTPTDINVGYTADETYLRRRLIVESGKVQEVEVEFPDGNMHVFDGKGNIKELRDRFGNVAALEVLTDAQLIGSLQTQGICRANTALVWRLSDPHGRQQYVCFRNMTYDSELKPMVDRISLTAFGGPRANYDFEYTQVSVQKPCDHEYWVGEPNPGYIGFPILQSVILRPAPNQTPILQWSFQTYATEGSVHECQQGSVQSVTLPTLGRVEYRYREWELPIQNLCLGLPGSTRYTSGISERVLYAANGAEVGRWKYSSELAPHQLSSLNCAPVGEPPSYPPVYEWYRTTVESPLGDKTESYFSVWWDPGNSKSAGNHPDGFRNEEYSRPFSRRGIDGNLIAGDGPFLSTSVLDCAVGGYGCTRLRSTFLHYTLEGPLSSYDPNRGARVDLTRTVYHDDGDRYRETESSDFDGLGHFRTLVTRSNFGAGDSKTTFTNWNPGSNSQGRRSDGTLYIPPANTVWLLNTYTQTRTTENGVTATTDVCFSPGNGFLSGRRVWKGDAPGANDVVTIYAHLAGNVTEENWYGGDRSPLTSSDICTPRLGSEYQITHGWSAGSHASSRHRGASFLSVDLTIDPSTGRASLSRDTAGQQTTYSYDLAGRLTSIAEPGVAATTYTYTAATTSAPAAVRAIRETTELQFQFDWFGRVWREKTKMADGTTSVRETLYNPLGWKTSVSEMETELNPSYSPAAKTTFNAYDPFGRAAFVTAPDNKSTMLEYAGDRLVTRRANIATSPTTLTEVATTEVRDGQQRLWQVIENAGVAGAEAVTTYGYDIGDRLSSVAMSGQQRFFQYDRRGFLVSEQHPEIGANGNGTISYLGYDSRGHAIRRITGGAVDLTFTFDGAERLTRVSETGGNVIKEFAYDDPTGATFAQCAGNACNGKLAAAVRWNRFDDLGSIAVTESYTYGGPGGRVSRRDQTAGTTTAFSGESFYVSQQYNSLGDIASVTYPCRMSDPACNPSRTVSYGYTNGLLTSVAGYGSITYQANGMPRTVAHSNSISDTILRDRSGMARPCSLASYGPGAALLTNSTDPCGETITGGGNSWTSGEYEYDGAGNIRRIGDTRYSYDALNRLTSWSTSNGTNVTTVSRAYDTFGNFLFSGVTTCRTGASRACAQTSTLPLSIAGTTNHYAGVTYDAAGAVTSIGDRTFVYDAAGMAKSSTSAGRQFRYLYTPDDERIAVVERIGNANKTLWTLRGLSQQLLRVWSDDATSGPRTWTWREDPIWRGSLLLASETPSGVRHYSVDHLGTPRWITGPNGAHIGYQTLDPFGMGGTADQTLQFTGHERDNALTGDTSGDTLDYMHARYYWGGWGRFLSVDPGAPAFEKPQSWNRYVYALGNPVNSKDPDGRETCDQSVLGCVVDAAKKFLLSSIPTAENPIVLDPDRPIEALPSVVMVLGILTPAPGDEALGAAAAATVRNGVARTGARRAIPALSADIAATFENAEYVGRILVDDMIGYRAEGQGMGRWMSTMIPDSAAAAEKMFNILGSNPDNTLTHVQAYRIPAGTIIYEGRVAGGSGTQIFIPNVRRAGVTPVGSPVPLPAYGF